MFNILQAHMALGNSTVDALIWVLWLRVFITAGLAIVYMLKAKMSAIEEDKTIYKLMSIAFTVCTWSAFARVDSRMGAVLNSTGHMMPASDLLPSEVATVIALGTVLIYLLVNYEKKSECIKLGCVPKNRRESDRL